MAEKHHNEETSKIQDSSQDPSLLSTSSSHKSKKEEQETIRESKRRKNCPSALDKIEELTPSNPNFSFTFDTQFSGNSQEFTPKFGSFNSVASTQERVDDSSLCFHHQSLEHKEGGDQEEKDKQQVGVSEEKMVNFSTLRRSVDGIREIK
ncbi:unnamed protein product [Dovyalis caffra]|uniref:Uncharacterized protein n=1 Tax=Dovyalis caffra TaxID=77055 RepID=A0AAV1RUD4_9ROSI|nr:unnamed protein product [Dovyalis caffra]